jgi:GNAT superfamily N-acetyltransferase
MRCGAFLDRETYVMLPRVDGQLAGDHPLSVVRTFAPKSRADAEVAVVGALLDVLDDHYKLQGIDFRRWGNPIRGTSVQERLVYWKGDKPVGFLAWRVVSDGSEWGLPGRRCGFILGIGTHPDHEGQGVGAALTKKLEANAVAEGASHLVLKVDSDPKYRKNREKFFRKQGFQELDGDQDRWGRPVS